MNSGLSITFLGTGTSQGIPVIGSTHPVCLSDDSRDKRLRVSVLLEWDTKSVVIDCGPDFRQQMLRTQISELHGVLLTHEHSDHTAGIDDIRPFYFRQGDIPFFATEGVFKSLHQRFSYIFETKNKYPGAPTITQNIVSKNASFELYNKMVIPIEAMHASLPILGYKIDGFVYLTDVKTIEETEILKIENCDVLVINALQVKTLESHFNLEDALEFVKRVQPKEAYFTHISHHLGFHAEVEEQLPKNVHLAYDGLKIEV
jgi:phosphoribosyl 1,2-cyclic phosphate phosphodiesterase